MDINAFDLSDGRKLSYLFKKYDEKYFYNKLKDVRVSWSDRMTLCTGKTYISYRGKFKFCSIRLSKPILIQCSSEDTINTLLHEMIHAYLFLTKGKALGEGHGDDFRNHMKRINDLEGTRIKICHNFHKEVNKFRIHIYKCDGPCRYKKPFYGIIQRAILRPPGPEDKWWSRHSEECGGSFHKISDLSKEAKRETDSGHSSTARFFHRKTALTLNGTQDLRNGGQAGKYRLVKANVNPRYVSEISRINVHKYITKYIEYNKGISGIQETKDHSSEARKEAKRETDSGHSSTARFFHRKIALTLGAQDRNGGQAGKYRLVKANVNPRYESEISRINVHKYITKYVEYNKCISDIQGTKGHSS